MYKVPKILTIDDEYVLRQSIVAYLEDSGYEVCEAENGRQGLEIFEEEKPDLVLTDLQMPETGGLEVLESITKKSPETPVIVISGAGSMSDVIEALRLGAWDYITKPIIDFTVLEHSINKYLERYRLKEENKVFSDAIQKSLATLEEDQAAGKSVQRCLLPEEEQIFGKYLFKYRVTPSLYMSGDFVEYFRISEDKVGMYLADVSGHGASSAFVTVLLKSLVTQIHARYQVHSDKTIFYPQHTMEELSYEIHTAKLGKYMTMIYGVIDLNTHEYLYGVGGHYPNPMFLEADGSVQFLEGSGYPIGIVPSVSYQQHSLQMIEGSKIVLFSDGIMELFMKDQEMSKQESGLLDVIKDIDGDIDEFYKILGVPDQPDKELPDDITMLTMYRSG